MKLKLVFALLLGTVMSVFAQGGYQDGIDYYNASRYTEAKRILTKTLNDPSTDKAVAYYYLGCIALHDDADGKVDFAAAKANFDKGVEANPNYALNYLGLAEIALKQGDKSAASELIKTAEKLGKKDAVIDAAIARTYFNVDPVAYAKEIRKYIDKGYKDSKNTEPAVYMIEGDYTALTSPGTASGFYDTAIRMAQERGDRVNPEAYVKCANTLFNFNKAASLEYLENLNTALPTSALAQRELAEWLYQDNQWNKAAVQYGKYMANPNHFPEDEARYCFLLFYGDNYEKSLGIARDLIKKDPKNYSMACMELYNLVALKRWEEAATVGERIISAPDFNAPAKAYDDYINALVKSGQNEKAIEVAKAALAKYPDRGGIYEYMADSYANLKDYANAADAELKYVDSNEANATATNLYYVATYYFQAALNAPENSAERNQYADKGLAAIDRALAKVDNSGLLWRCKARLLLAKVTDPSKFSPEIAQAYEKMIDSFAQETNGADRSSYLAPAYGYLCNYYLSIGDKETARGYSDKLNALQK